MTTAASAEASRVAALRRYGTNDMPAEHELAALVRLAATIAGVPTATLNLLDDETQRSYSTFGFEAGSCPRDDSMCVVALRERTALTVPDALLDPRFADNPHVDGRLARIRFYASSPLMTPDGWMIGTLCVFDTEPGQLSPAARQALDDLASTAMALLERRRLARRAEEATRAKSQFLATMTHELRTPLHAVLGMLELALHDELPTATRDKVELARRSGTALVSLVDDLLDLSKGEAGSVTLQPAPFDPAAVVRDVGDALRVLAERKGLSLVVRVGPDVPSAVLGDADRVRQVLVNLVGNAVKFSDTGSVELVLTAHDSGDGDVALVMAVRDTGEGIPSAELATLFTPYAQGRSGHRHGGTGLGLSICGQLAELMGGRLDVSSVLGVGSTFRFSVILPRAAGPTAQDEPDDASWAGLRVLVADDDGVNRLVATGLLQSLGAVVEVVADGATAVSRAASGGFDVVLLDHEMPGMDGPSAARAIRALPAPASRARIYALTGRADRSAVYRDAGMDGVLRKPLDAAALACALTPPVTAGC